jgi:hypothetical protein
LLTRFDQIAVQHSGMYVSLADVDPENPLSLGIPHGAFGEGVRIRRCGGGAERTTTLVHGRKY